MSGKPKFLRVVAPDFADVGDALVDEVKRRIRDAPGNRWNKTGHLLASIAAVKHKDGVAVVAASDRLQSDEVAQKFADEIIPDDISDETRLAIAQAIFAAFTVEK